MFLDQTHFGKLYMDICFLKSTVLWPYYISLYMKMYHIWYYIWENAWIVDMEKWASFIQSLIRKSLILWYIRKFKDSYLVLLCEKLIENLLTRMKLKILQTLWKLDYLKFFWNYLDINCVSKLCNLSALCGFNTMPCVISR